MAAATTNKSIKFFGVDHHDHFSVITPITQNLAAQILKGKDFEFGQPDLQ